jgi:hypothetical protein
MKRSKFSEEQIAYALRQAESGTPVPDVCRQPGVSEAIFCVWKKKFAHLGARVLLPPGRVIARFGDEGAVYMSGVEDGRVRLERARFP